MDAVPPRRARRSRAVLLPRSAGDEGARPLPRGTLTRALVFAALLLGAACAAAEPRFSFLSTPGRLPKDVVPKHYALRIVPASTQDRFTGTVRIDVEVAKPVAALELNAQELQIQKAR